MRDSGLGYRVEVIHVHLTPFRDVYLTPFRDVYLTPLPILVPIYLPRRANGLAVDLWTPSAS